MVPKKRRPRRTPAPLSPDRDNTLGQFVRGRRKADGLTQRELAELAGVGARVVWDLERGKPTMRMDAVRSVLAVFGKTLGVVDAAREVDR